MRKESFELCKRLFEEFGVNLRGKSIDVGGAPTVVYNGNGSPNPILSLTADVEYLDPDGSKGADHKIDFLDGNSVALFWEGYDVVYCFDTLEHVSDPFVFSEHLLGVAKIGGYVFVATVFKWPYHPSPEDYWRFTPTALRLLFTRRIWAEAEVLWCDWNGENGVALLARRAR